MRGHDVPLEYHRGLIDDPVRVHAYDRAVRALVRPGDVVLDVGAGTGLLSMLAARRGARVHAVESMPVAELARELVAHNGLSDRITVHRADLVGLEPVEPVDLVLGDWLGRFLVDDQMLDAIAAAGRWAKPGARFCPSEVRLRLAPVGDFAHAPVDRFRRPLLGLDLSPAVRRATSTCYAVQLAPSALLADPAEWIRYRPGGSFVPDGEASFRIARDGLLRGVAGWFEADLAPGIVLSTEPGVQTHWGQYLFPMAPRPVRAGEALELRLSLLDGEALCGVDRLGASVWRWRGRVGGEAFNHRSDPWTPSGSPSPVLVPLDPAPVPRAEAIERNRIAAEALIAGRLDEALAGFEALVAGLLPEDDDLAGAVYENLGLARYNTGDRAGALEAFLRAVDGDPGARPQSLAFLVRCASELGRQQDAERWAREYETRFGRSDVARTPDPR